MVRTGATFADAAAEFLRYVVRWSEQELLDPPAAADTLRALMTEVDRVEPTLGRLRARHREVASELLRRSKKTDD
jgi:hypothetical protein